METEAAERIVSLFSGIGGIELGLERAGLGAVVAQVEIDAFCRKVLARHWPSVKRFSDVRQVGLEELGNPDILCGGFPCQDVSVAGKRAGITGSRSGLWSEYARIVEETMPKAVVVENVPGLRTAGLRTVLADFAGLGFDAEWCTFEAAWLGAPHLRSRIWIVATHPERVRVRHEPGWLERSVRAAFAPVSEHLASGGFLPDADGVRRLQQSWKLATLRGWAEQCGWQIGSPARVDAGSPERLVGPRRKALGNAVVVQCAEAVGRALSAAVEFV